MHELNEKKSHQIVEVSLKCYKISLYNHIELRIVFHLAKVPRPQWLTKHRFVTIHMLSHRHNYYKIFGLYCNAYAE